LRLEKQIEEIEKKATISPLMPCYAASVSKKHGHDSQYAKEWVGEKA
jgi:hypothetical protein